VSRAVKKIAQRDKRRHICRTVKSVSHYRGPERTLSV